MLFNCILPWVFESNPDKAPRDPESEMLLMIYIGVDKDSMNPLLSIVIKRVEIKVPNKSEILCYSTRECNPVATVAMERRMEIEITTRDLADSTTMASKIGSVRIPQIPNLQRSQKFLIECGG